MTERRPSGRATSTPSMRILLLSTLPLLLPASTPNAALPSEEQRAEVLHLPSGQPESFELDVVLAGAGQTLVLERHSLRAPGARVRTQASMTPDTHLHTRGDWVEFEPPPVRTYRGHIAGAPRYTVLASLAPEGLNAEIFDAAGNGWTIEAPSDGSRRHVTRTRSHDHWLATACGMEEEGLLPVESDLAGTLARMAGQPLPSGTCLKRAEIAFDADFEYYQAKGSSIPNVVAAIDAIMNQVDFFYARDILITHEISAYVVRTAPFYTPVDGGDLLNQFRTEWTTNQASIPHDIGHLMTGKPGSLIEFGGLAFVGVVCTGSSYGWSMDGANIVGHELGHNWGAGHCHDPTPCNNMCGACFNIGPNTKEIMEVHRDSRTCLEDAAFYPTPLPPYAHPEGLTLHKGEFDDLGPTTFQVLDNDHDGNCEALRLFSFDSKSEQGGTIRLVPTSAGSGTGTAFLEALEYTPPTSVFLGADTFHYLVGDPGGRVTEGTVTIDVRPQDLQAYWKLDEGSGETIYDETPNQVTATAFQPFTWVAGRFGTAMRFNGNNQVLSSNGAAFGAPWTVTTWFKRLTGSGPSAALIESSNGSIRTEQWPNTGKIGITRYGVGDFTFNTSVPLNIFVHLAFVGTENETKLYINGQLVDTLPVGIDGPIAPASRAADPLRGALDELRVYGYDLSASEVSELHALGGPAVIPHPADGGPLADVDGELTWDAGLQADSHDVYFGTGYAAVRDAETSSPEYMGNQLGTSYTPLGILKDTTYYWRVDERVGASVVRGGLWQFGLIDHHRWPLDETSGTVALDTIEGKNGTYRAGALLNQPGATALLGTAVRFDGINDRVEIPALELHSNRVTITAWIRRDGGQSANAGLVHSRDGNTVAGLNFGNANELRYHWNNSSSTWGWDSGLVVPDDTWVFVALVVEETRATLYLGDGGVLSSAVNTVMHSDEEFDGELDLGRDRTGGRWFKGWMDDVRIYRGALEAVDVDALYQSAF